MHQDEINIESAAKMASLETRLLVQESMTKKLDLKVDQIVDEVRQIRNAIYAMAGMIALNVPALRELFGLITKFFH